MKKGFTLIEVLAVIVILSIISLIVFPEVNKIIKNSKQKSYDTQIKSLIEATESLIQDNDNLLPAKTATATTTITLSDLMQAGKIKTDVIYDPRDTSQRLTGCVQITYSMSYNQYIYEYKEPCS